MLYSYSGFPERSFCIFSRPGDLEAAKEHADSDASNLPVLQLEDVSNDKSGNAEIFSRPGDLEAAEEHADRADSDASNLPVLQLEDVSNDKNGNAENDLQDRKDSEQNELPKESLNAAQLIAPQGHANDSSMARNIRVKMNVMSGLSIILTLMSILVAFR
jgi:high-affinity nickel-transport protein